jgi:hypothetical protein
MTDSATSTTSFPIFERLDVEAYGLFPGTKKKPGLHVEFQPGTTLILGANGLGKTTLVSMLYRLCTGPYELPKLSGRELGGRRRGAIDLTRTVRRTFADRVSDDARNALASLVMSLGGAEISVTRRLDTLALERLVVDGRETKPDEASYQAVVLERAALPTLGDWILVLRHLTFYFEDRRALVWDATAQRQLLRLLFLPVPKAEKWAELERGVLQLDSNVRNDQYALTRAERATTQLEEAIVTNVDVKKGLRRLERQQKRARELASALEEEVVQAESARQRARLEALRADADHESAKRDLERRQLRVIDAAFPTENETMRYLITKIASGESCLVCGALSTDASESVQRRLASAQCVVCGSRLQPQGISPLSSRSVTRAEKTLSRTAIRLDATRTERATAERERDSLLDRLQLLNAQIAERSVEIDGLLKRLPPEDSEVHKQRDELAASRARLELMKRELERQRDTFARFVDRVIKEIREQRAAVQESFENFAEGFLLEDINLNWEPQKDRVGETGRMIDFPAYQLDMSGSDFPSPVRRSGPDQVSESQREFIDLAFRMALMQVAGGGAGASLVIDAPESSLDAVFVTRAATVLTRFAGADGPNRLIVTSNLVEGDLIPALLRKAGIRSSRNPRVVDLLGVAAPTAATKELADDYRRVRRNLFPRPRRRKSWS